MYIGVCVLQPAFDRRSPRITKLADFEVSCFWVAEHQPQHTESRRQLTRQLVAQSGANAQRAGQGEVPDRPVLSEEIYVLLRRREAQIKIRIRTGCP